MSLRSAVFGTLTTVGCMLLSPIVQRAQANTEPPHPSPAKPPTSAAAGVELPFFEPGLWEYRRMMVKDGIPSPRIEMLRKCADPSTEIREKMAQLRKRDCRFAPLVHRLQRYNSSWICPTPLGSTRFHAVLIVRGTVRYTDVSEMRTSEHVSRQRIEAIRIGECPASGPDRQFRPNPQPQPSTF